MSYPPQQSIELWPDVAPASADPAVMPTLHLYPATNPTGAGVLVLPGGGYSGLATDHEGEQVAEFLNARGIAAFVCHYRRSDTGHHHPAPLADAIRAIRWVRAHAADFDLDPARLGVMGFSAGGHLAATLSNHHDYPVETRDAIDQQPARPDFSILIYPVISFDSAIYHGGSCNNFCGPVDDAKKAELVATFSNENAVTADTPPTLLVHSADDGAVPLANSTRYYDALLAADVPSELHVYPTGGHGYGMEIQRDGAPNWLGVLGDFIDQF